MNIEELNLNVTARFQSLQETLQEVLRQLFNQDFSLKMDLEEDRGLQDMVGAEAFPRILAQFQTEGLYTAQHIVSLPPDLVVSLYAWMIGGEPEAEVSDEHLEGLREGAGQLFGQIQAAMDAEGSKLTVSEINFEKLDSADGFNLEEKTGTVATYSVEVAGSTNQVTHYILTEFGEAKDGAGTTPQDLEDLLNDADFGAVPDDSEQGADETTADVEVRSVEFGEFNPATGGNGKTRNIDMLMDVELEVLVELGRKTMMIRDVLKLGKGSVVELDKAAGEPLGIFVNGRKLAEGEVVVVDDHFGIRITQLAGPAERIRSLG